MTEGLSAELFFISLVVLLLLLIILLVLCWILRRSRSRNFTELKLSVGGITHVLTIRTEPDHADQLMDRMLDRVFLQVKADPGEKLGVELRAEPKEELAEASGSDPEDSTTSRPSRAVNVQNMGLWKWAILRPPKAAPPPSVDQDHIDVHCTKQSNVSQHAPLSSQGSSSSSSS